PMYLSPRTARRTPPLASRPPMHLSPPTARRSTSPDHLSLRAPRSSGRRSPSHLSLRTLQLGERRACPCGHLRSVSAAPVPADSISVPSDTRPTRRPRSRSRSSPHPSRLRPPHLLLSPRCAPTPPAGPTPAPH